MNKRYLFRGKRKDTGEWVEGSPIDKDYILQYIDLAEYWELLTSDHKVTCRAYEVIPETVTQFTGIRDKNNKDIYEGDFIVGERSYMSSRGYKSKKYPDRIKVICVLEWDSDRAGWLSKEIGPIQEHKEADKEAPYHQYHTSIGASNGIADWVEVIGNCFDNPELLIQ